MHRSSKSVPKDQTVSAIENFLRPVELPSNAAALGAMIREAAAMVRDEKAAQSHLEASQ